MDVRDAGIAGMNYYADQTGGNPPYCRAIPGSITGLYARPGLVARLAQANRSLEHLGYELFVFDAYRPLRCQAGLWEFFVEKWTQDHPSATRDHVEQRVRRYVSDPRSFDPRNEETWPVHACGGAVDLTLRALDTKALLPMGADFDQMDETSAAGYYEGLLASGEIGEDHALLQNRRVLYWALTDAGLTNYRHEYWHYDYGDRLYCEAGGRRSYWYGYVPSCDLPG